MKLWPYRILKKNDNDIKADLGDIMQHFAQKSQSFDMIVFVPNAGKYLSDLFLDLFISHDVEFVTVRRASTVSKENKLKKIIFKNKHLADLFRHADVLFRLIKYKLCVGPQMVSQLSIDFEVKDKLILVIDDDLATGTTLEMVKSLLLKHGAYSVNTATISNHFLPNRIKADYSVYNYVLLRTKNSRDFYAS